jgi:hypothetical protein
MRTYTTSGIVPIAGGILTALAAIAVTVLCAFVYAYAFRWMPLGLLRIFLFLGYCFAVGIAISTLGKWTKIRSPLFIIVLAVACTLVGLWIHWGASVWAKEGAQTGLAAWSPAELVAFGQRLFENGSFKIRRSTIDGWLLVAFWIAEAGGMFALIAGSAQAHVWQPFCESCGQWTTNHPGMIRLAANGKEPAWDQVLAGDFALLATYPLANAQTSPHVRLDLATCPSCNHSNFLSLAACTIKYDKKGKATTKEESLLSHGVLNDIQAEMIRELAHLLANEQDHDYAGEGAEIDDGAHTGGKSAE